MGFRGRLPYIATTASAYVVFGSLWIVFSDNALLGIIDRETLVRLAVAKGLLFVVLTAGLFVLAMRMLPPAPDAAVASPKSQPHERPWPVLGALTIAAVVIAGIVGLTYTIQLKSIESGELAHLQALTDTMTAQISQWLDERRSAVTKFAAPKLSDDDVGSWIARHDGDARRRLLDNMRFYCLQFGFSRAAILDAAGRTVLAYPETQPPFSEADHARFDDMAHAGPALKIVQLGDGTNAGSQMAFVAPVPRGDWFAGVATAGAVVFTFDTREQLTPLIDQALQTTRTGETVLVRYAGRTLFHLSRLRHKHDAAADSAVRMPDDDPLVQALKRDDSTFRGVDYRGEPVLSAARPVPGTDWIVIAKIDTAEVEAAYNQLTLRTAAMIAITLIAAAVLIGFLWQRRQLRSAMAALELRHYLAKIAEASPGAMFTFRMAPDGTISMPYASEKFRELSGIDPAEIVADASSIYQTIHPDDIPGFRDAVQASARDLQLFDHRFRINQPGHGTIWVEVRAMPERKPDGATLWHGFGFDVTTRRREEEAQRLAATVFDAANEGIVVCDPDGRIVAVNPAFTVITGYAENEAIGKTPKILQSGRHGADFYRDMWQEITTSGRWRGEIWNRRKSGSVYPERLSIGSVRDKQDNITGYVATFSDISDIKQSKDELVHLAHHDPLTKLPNRVLFRLRVEHAMMRARRHNKRCALLMLDLDRFKTVNDSLGHHTGDELLTLVAARLTSCTRDGDTVARIGGDEFAILIEDIDDRGHIIDCAQRIVATLALRFKLDSGREITTGGSIGISVFPDDGTTANELFKNADTALYEAKRQGGGNYAFYSQLMSEAVDARMELESNMRDALERGEFTLHYQPLVDMRAFKLTGVEALMRWRGPGGASIAPGLFIPVAEETGMIIPLGDWALRTACRQMRAFLDAGLTIETVAVNLSPMQFHDKALIDRIGAALRESRLPARHLEIELTESALIGSSDDIVARLKALKALGVRLAVDDFGTGYSSFVYLKTFPIDKIKIDRSFIADLETDETSRQITRAIIAMARSLKIEVLAEGVETAVQLEFLKAQGCDAAQGFYFGAAMAEDELTARLKAGKLFPPSSITPMPGPRRAAG
jgi:diguanylate cyclase (GGDEF)-like protein/PAS domain S-box-containing protein